MAKLVSWCSATPGPVMPHWIKHEEVVGLQPLLSDLYFVHGRVIFVCCAAIKCIFCIRGEKSQTFLRQKRKQDWNVQNTFHNHVTGFIFINVIWYVITHSVGWGGCLRPPFQALTTRLLRSLPEKCRGLDGMSGVGVEISRDGALWSPVTSQAVKRGTGGRSDQTEQL